MGFRDLYGRRCGRTLSWYGPRVEPELVWRGLDSLSLGSFFLRGVLRCLVVVSFRILVVYLIHCTLSLISIAASGLLVVYWSLSHNTGMQIM